MSHLRSLVIALVVLGLSAGAVFASRSLADIATASSSGLANASAASGLALPAGRAPSLTAHSEASSGTTATEADDTTGTDETTGTDSTTGTKPTDNHGAFVSAAAHLSFDELKVACVGFDGKNKGAYISAIARGLLVVTLPTDASAGTTVDTTTGTTAPTITCTVAPATAAPSGSSPTAPTAASGTAPTRLHGQANAAAKRTLHQRHTHD